jgi:hypothetical protein
MRVPAGYRVLVVTAALAALAGCGSGANPTRAASEASGGTTGQAATGDGTPASRAMPDPCSLLRDSEVAGLDPSLGPGETKTVAGSRLCVWHDAKGITAVTLLVAPAPQGGPKVALRDALAPSGYTIDDVPGLGDSAAVAVQQADASIGTKEAVAEIVAQTGDRIVELATPRVPMTERSAKFAIVKHLTATALSRLPG